MGERTPPPLFGRSGLVILGSLAIWLFGAALFLLPNSWQSIRVLGVSLDWWYLGVLAPILAVGLLVLGATPGSPGQSDRGSSSRETS